MLTTLPVRNSTRMSSLRKMSPIYIGYLASSPIGPIWVAVSARGLVRVDWEMPQAEFSRLVEHLYLTTAIYDPARTSAPTEQLAKYLKGNLRQFTLPLDLSGMTPFQGDVLHLTIQIPYGETSTYKEIAIRANKPNAARAVGRVEATNPIPLVIPCHRVLGSDDSLHGYGGPGGIKLKAWLLEMERNS